MEAFENFKIEKVGDERLEERIRLAYIRKTVLEDDIHELTSEGEGGVGRAYEELNEASEDFYMLLELRERRGVEDDKPIIRHCRNCKFAELRTTGDVFCDVKYTLHLEQFQRIDAILCKYYKPKEQTPEFLNKRVNVPESNPKSAIENLAKATEKFAKNTG